MSNPKSVSKPPVSAISIIDKAIHFSFYSLFFFTPLLMASVTSELFEFNKMLFIYFIAILVSFAWIVKMIFAKKIIIKKTPLDIPIIIFLASQILSTIFSIDRHTSLFGYYGRFNGGLISIIAYLVLFYAFVSNVAQNSIAKILKMSLISSLIVILWGLPGKAGHDLSCLLFLGQFNNSCWTDQFRPAERMFSTLGQPNWLGAYLAINFFIGLYFFLNEKKSKKYLFYLYLCFSSILFTRSRSALASIFIAFIPLGIYLFIQRNKFGDLLRRLKYLGLGLIIAVFLFKTGIARLDKIIDLNTYTNLMRKKEAVQIKNRSNTVNQSSPAQPNINVTESFDIRKIVWTGALELGRRYPLFGTGVESFAYSYYFVRPITHNLTSEWDYLYNKAHNEFLNYLATTGYIGLISYFLVIGFSSYLIFKKKDDYLIFLCLGAAYITISVTNFFGFSTSTINIFFYLIPALILVFENKEIQTRAENIEKLDQKQKIYVSVISLAALFLFVFLIRYWMADLNYAEGDKYYRNGYYQISTQYFQNALKLKGEHVYEDKLAYSLANLSSSYYANKQNDQAEKIMKLAEYYNGKSLNQSPKNILYWKTKAKIYYIFFLITSDQKYIEVSLDALSTASSIAPTDPKIPLFKAQFYGLIADEQKDRLKKNEYNAWALKQVNNALKLKPDYTDALTFKSQLEEKL